MYFESVDNSKHIAQCRICGRELCYRLSTKNLNHHIQRNHPVISVQRDSLLPIRPVPFVQAMPHPSDNNYTAPSDYIPPAAHQPNVENVTRMEQSNTAPTNYVPPAAHQQNTSGVDNLRRMEQSHSDTFYRSELFHPPYARNTMNEPIVNRAPNQVNVNYELLQPVGMLYDAFYQPNDPLFPPNFLQEFNIQLQLQNAEGNPKPDTRMQTNHSNVAQRESSDESSSEEDEEEPDDNDNNDECTQNKCDQLLRKWIIVNGYPFSMIQQREFIEFMMVLNPTYILPTLDGLISDMRADYLKFAEKVRQQLLNSVSVCITAESLISKNNCRYLALTAHYIDKQFKEHVILFDCCEMVRCDKTSSIESVIDTTLAKFFLTGRVTTFVSDSTAFVKEMFADNYSWNYFGCYGLKLRTIAKDLKHLAVKFLVKYCPTVRLDPDLYLQDIMETISDVFATLPNFVDEYNICADIIKVLKPFEELILFVGNRYVCMSEFFLINRSLVAAYDKLMTETFTEDIKKAVQTVFEKLTKLAEHEYMQPFAYATFLDPRFKNMFSANADEASSIKDTFIEELTAMFKSKKELVEANNEENATAAAEGNTQSTSSSIFKDFDKMVEESQIPGNYLHITLICSFLLKVYFMCLYFQLRRLKLK